MKAALLLLRPYYKHIAAVVAMFLLWMYWHNLTSTIDAQEVTISRLTSDNKTLSGNVATLQTAINANNTAIIALSAGADKTKTDFANLNTTVAGQISALAPKLDAIRRGAKPISCPDTMQYLLDARKEFPK